MKREGNLFHKAQCATALPTGASIQRLLLDIQNIIWSVTGGSISSTLMGFEPTAL